MNMKKLKILFFVFMVTCVLPLSAQSVIGTVTGKWLVVKYNNKSMGTKSQSDTLVFQPDGFFTSENLYFGAKKGLFRSDENRKMLITEADNNNTIEWVVSFKKGILRLKSVRDKRKPYVVIELVKADEKKAEEKL